MIYYINKQTTVLLYPNPLSCVFTCFSACGRVLCTNKRLYDRLSRTGSRKTYRKTFYLNPIGFAPISGLWS